ncbi:MGDG synthase family glycosyltransferase [Capillimicrobium parvum]|uniref:Processive diacylglycerol beta-glucosyltransferase n=1 Tax=Capillimicrobium parvum TaxID=2884022 RepID=A0A9E6XXE9_9ACTN|nr:glycosyltransferase [Capillimicrobium parvum]UGS36138.1 Processive diacylglycerol beta-glucosyltransferase [Capillimicrobium parvum]
MSLRVLILSADIGEGHNTAARALAQGLRRRGAVVHVDEHLESLSAAQRLALREGSRLLFRHAPWAFGAYYRLLLRSRTARALARASLVRFGARPMLRMIDRHRPDVIVSTYPATTVVLGELRRRGAVRAPVVATITDVTGLFFWAAPRIDLHLVSWRESIEEVLTIAPGSDVRHVAGLTDRVFQRPRSKREARTALGLAADRPVVVVSGGGWGVGDLAGAACAALAVPGAQVIVAAGRDPAVRARLERRIGAAAGLHVLGFTDRMSDLLAAADVLVHATGGVTCLEARLRGCPVVLYGFAVGHVRHNAVAMERLGLSLRARRPAELTAAIVRILQEPAPNARPCGALPSAANAVMTARALDLAPVPVRRAPSRVRGRVAVAALVGALVVAGFAQTAPGDAIADHARLHVHSVLVAPIR